MKLFFSLMALMVFVAACTMTPHGDSMKGEFNPPFMYRGWNMNLYDTKSGDKACAISSGYNGLTVLVGTRPTDIAVKGNRPVIPGSMLNVTVGDMNFQSYEEYFPKSSAFRMVDAMSKGGEAYLEWQEESGTYGNAPVRVQNIVKLDNFAAQLKQCREELK